MKLLKRNRERCIGCDERPPRESFGPEPEGRMWTEWMTERPLYCRQCFEEHTAEGGEES
jgi:hypothetical protein